MFYHKLLASRPGRGTDDRAKTAEEEDRKRKKWKKTLKTQGIEQGERRDKARENKT